MIQDVKVIPGCISCRSCESVCPKIFRVNPTSQVISRDFTGNESEILEAEALCPVNVIKVSQDGTLKLSFKQATLSRKTFLTSDIVELVFESENEIPFTPGQYINLLFSDWKGRFSRSYSLAGTDGKGFTLTIKLGKKGRGSSQIRKMKLGKKIEFLGPLGAFTLKNTQTKKYFIATGTGLAPFIPMLEACEKNKIETECFIGARTSDELYYTEKLSQFQYTKVHYCLSREEKLGCYFGRVTDMLEYIPENAEVYICGNPDMLQSVKSDLEKKNFPKNQVFSEAFTVSQTHLPVWKEILVQGNIPGKNIIFWTSLLFGLIIFPSIYLYREFSGISLYDDFLFFGGYQSFLWKVSWYSACIVMMIRPLSDLFSKSNFLRSLKFLRQPLGILSSAIIVLGVVSGWIVEPSSIATYFNPQRWSGVWALTARASEVTALILLLTSNIWSQKKLGIWWKRIQRSSYIYFISGGIIAAAYSPVLYYSSLSIWAALFLLALGKNFTSGKK